jgi:membrane protease YdiL (CAAX protease family)
MTQAVTRIFWKVVRFPLTRIVVALALVGGLVTVLQPRLQGLDRWLSTLILIVAADLAYRLFVRVFEWRRASELGFRRTAGELAAGIAIGAALFAATVGALWLARSYRFVETGTRLAVAAALPAAIRAGYVEEILLRGIVFRITEEGLGSWLALVISGGLFGLLHAGNPGATWVSTVAIALEAGVLLAAAYMVTQRLWLPIGIHFAWNFTQGGIFGLAVSGHQSTGLLRGELSGPIWMSGGSFGAEASVLAVLICLLAGACLLLLARSRRHIVPPFWKEPRRTGGTGVRS